MAELIKLGKMVGGRPHFLCPEHLLHSLATNVPFIACVINLSGAFAYYSDL